MGATGRENKGGTTLEMRNTALLCCKYRNGNGRPTEGVESCFKIFKMPVVQRSMFV